MARKEIVKSIRKFEEACAKKGYPVEETCLVEAYPGDVSTSYILEVRSDWISKMSNSEALDILIEILFNTVPEAHRQYIFSISLLDNKKSSHCESDKVAAE